MKAKTIIVLLIVALAMASIPRAYAQSGIVLNGGTITLQNGGQLVIDNGASSAIVRTSGYIQCLDAISHIKWSIGTNTGTYLIPWGTPTGYLPLSFSPSGATGSGSFLLGTYNFPSWNNSVNLPSGIAHFNNASGVDHSAFSADRFWRIEPTAYSVKPNLSSLVFTYNDADLSASGNTITESSLRGERWNSDVSSWTDAVMASVANTTNNTVTVTSVSSANLFAWWNLSTGGANKYWIAGNSSTWNNAANWSFNAGGAGGAGAPGADDVVFFDGAMDGACSVNANVTLNNLNVQAGYAGAITQGANTIAILNDLNVEGGAFQGGSGRITVGHDITISSGSFVSTSDTLVVANNFTFSAGTFAHNQGVVKFTGTNGLTQQLLQGGAVLPLHHISIANGAHSSQLMINNAVEVSGVLTLGAGASLDADGGANTGTLTLRSTSDAVFANAAIAPIPANATFTGNVTVQRFMSIEGPNNSRIYRYIGSPIANAVVSDLQNEIPVTGSFSGTSICAGCGTNQSMFEYREEVITDTNGNGTSDSNDGYLDFPQSANSEALVPGRGYSLFVRGNAIASARWDVRGVINAGNVSPVVLPVTYTSSGTLANDGWNLVSNPYASTIDWNAAAWSRQNLENAIYIRDNSSSQGRFASYNGTVGTNGGSQYIALGQAFWVKADGNGVPVLQAGENVKVPYQPVEFFREEHPSNLIRVIMKQGNEVDEAVIHFREDATGAFDRHADARKMYNANFNVSSLTETDERLSINSWLPLVCSTSTKISVARSKPGSYVFEFGELASLQGNVSITLVDQFLNSSVIISKGYVYPFIIDADPKSGGDRFVLQFEKTPEEINIAQDGMTLSIDHKNNVQWYLNGNPIEGATFSDLEITTGGVYSVTVSRYGCSLSGARTVIVTGEEHTASEIVNVYPNPVEDHLWVELEKPASVSLMNSVGQIVSSKQIETRDEFDLSALPSGLYIIKVSIHGDTILKGIIKK